MDLMLIQVKKPSETKSVNDVFNIVATVPEEQVFPTAEQSGCPLLQA